MGRHWRSDVVSSRDAPGHSTMTSLRRPPAFQVYAADELAAATYYSLSLAERGLLDAMRRVVWCDDGIPADPAGIALAIRRTEGETRDALTPRVLAHFEPIAGSPGLLTCPELSRQMTRLLALRAKQSKAAASTNATRRTSKRGDRDGERSAQRRGKRDGVELNRTEPNPSIGKATNSDGIDTHEVAAYERVLDEQPIPAAPVHVPPPQSADDYRPAGWRVTRSNGQSFPIRPIPRSNLTEMQVQYPGATFDPLAD